MATELDPSCEQITSPARSILIRIDDSATATERNRLTENAREAGFDGVEISLDTPGYAAAAEVQPQSSEPHVPADMCATGADAVIAAAACLRAREVETAVVEVTGLLRRAAGIGATCLNLTIPPLRTEPGEPGFSSYEEAMRLVLGLLRAVRFDVEAIGVALAIETGVHGGMLAPMELREMIDTANSWAVGACVDLGRTIPPGSSGNISALAMESITMLRRRIHTLRVPAPDRLEPAITSKRNPPASADRFGRNIERIAGMLDSVMYRNLIVVTGAGPPAADRRPTELCASSAETRNLRSLFESIRPIAEPRDNHVPGKSA